MAVISRGWKTTVAFFAMVGICGAQETNWTPAVRGGKLAASAEVPTHPETVARDIRSGLVLWVPANTSQTSAAWDYSTNAVPLDLTNSTAGQLPTWGTNGGGSWQFYGTNYFRTLSTLTSLATQGTYSIWGMMTNGGIQIALGSGLNTTGGLFSFAVRLSQSNTVSIVTGNGAANSAPESPATLTSNVWHFMTITHSNGNDRIYLDGILRLAVSNANWGHVGSTNIFVGSYDVSAGTPRFWSGHLDNPQIWTRALSSNEIFQLAWGPTNFGQRRAHNK